MSTTNDITQKSKRESESSISEPQSKNTARAGRACDDDYPEPQTDPAPASDEGPDKQGRKKKEPAQLTTYDPAGSIPFSEWDGEEGQPPHN